MMPFRGVLFLLAAIVLAALATAIAVIMTSPSPDEFGAASRWVRMHFGGPRASPLFYYATTSGKIAYDDGRSGGNPFADGLISALQRKDLKLSDLSSIVASDTQEFSRDPSTGEIRQVPVVPMIPASQDLVLIPSNGGSGRVALVIALAGYRAGVGQLNGARFDADRLGSALIVAGFDTRVRVDPTREEMRAELSAFSAMSAKSDVSIVYITGHGTEADGRVYLVPIEYRRGDPGFKLSTDAFEITSAADFLFAKEANMVFFGGCRNQPDFLR